MSTLKEILEAKLSPRDFDSLTRELYVIRTRGLPKTRLGKLFQTRRDLSQSEHRRVQFQGLKEEKK